MNHRKKYNLYTCVFSPLRRSAHNNSIVNTYCNTYYKVAFEL